jgi:SAM-dependent methyltransferase
MSAVESWGLVALVAVLAGLAFLPLREAVLYYWARQDLATARQLPGRDVRQRERHEALPDGPRLHPYERMAEVWEAYAAQCAPPYAAFVPALVRRYRLQVAAVLDLACGTGTLTEQLAERFPAVVGLDASPHMLERARGRCPGRDGVRFVQADFRSFDLPERFDLAVCAWDSLNYLDHPADLRRVLQSVHRHLRPGGLFVFDAITAVYFVAAARLAVRLGVGDVTFDFWHSYDGVTGAAETRVVFDSGVERHRRVPLEPLDVREAADDTGFAVLDAFSSDGCRFFYVLRRGDPPPAGRDGEP